MIDTLLMITHLLGLALGVGSASVKLVLLVRCTSDRAFIPVYLEVIKTITRLIVTGLILLTLSGIGWLLLGYGFTFLLILKLIIVGLIWILGPLIDNVFEPRFRKLAPLANDAATPEFLRIQKQYLSMEIAATGLMYVVTILGIFL